MRSAAAVSAHLPRRCRSSMKAARTKEKVGCLETIVFRARSRRTREVFEKKRISLLLCFPCALHSVILLSFPCSRLSAPTRRGLGRAPCTEVVMQLVINSFGASLRKQGDRFLIQAGDKKLEVSAHKVQSILISTAAHLSSDAIESLQWVQP